jgi:hypothetical protein
MSAGAGSGAYFGGIGAMLEAADVCPVCGRIHSESPFIVRLLRTQECPTVAERKGARRARRGLPAIEPPLRIPAAVKTREVEVPTSSRLQESTSLFVRRSDGNGPSRTLSVPWLSPPELDEVY